MIVLPHYAHFAEGSLMKYFKLLPLMISLFSLNASAEVDYQLNNWWFIKNNGHPFSVFSPAKIGIDLGLENVYSTPLYAATSKNRVLVAVIDSGLDFDHPDFQNTVALNQKDLFNNGVDDDENGLVDDTYGWNFFDNNFAPNDLNGHGTHVAGIIHKITQGRADILPIRYSGADASGNGWFLVQAINYAVLRGAKLINCSWDGELFEQNVLNAMKRAGEKGVLFVVAAGNNGTDNDALPNFPGNFGLDNILVVANLEPTGALDRYSNFGKKTVDIASPGTYIMSSKLGGGYVMMDGTSMASATATGSLALLKSLYPELSFFELKELLINYAQPNHKLVKRVKAGGFINISNVINRTHSPLVQIPESSWKKIPVKIESHHPYGSGHQIFFAEAPKTAKKMRLLFEKIEIANQSDQLCLHLKNEGVIECLSGKKENYTTQIMEGSKVTINLETYSKTSSFGFVIRAIDYIE